MADLRSPFPWFGGKSRVAPEVWQRFGDVQNYVEPFFGSGAVLLGRPDVTGTETINDLDGYVANFWRAIQHAPEAVAAYADNPVNENDLHSRHSWLVANCGDLAARLNGHPEYFDAKIAGWWVWGLCCWIGSGWCSGNGPWQSVDGKLIKVERDAGQGVNRQLPHLGNAGQGVTRGGLHEWFHALADRLRNVRVACGDWRRITGDSVTTGHGLTGVFLDPPYTDYGHLYTHEGEVGHDVAAWCRENGDNPLFRIALCGYEGEHDLPGWDCHTWKAVGGYGPSNGNPHRERIWFSPHCIPESHVQAELFA